MALFKVAHLEELEKWLSENDIQKQDVCLIGSCALAARGVRENHDLEFTLRPKVLKSHGLSRKVFCMIYYEKITDDLELWRNQLLRVGISDKRIFNEKLFDDINGYNILFLDIEKLYKSSLGRDKDFADIVKIEMSDFLQKYTQTKKDKVTKIFYCMLNRIEWCLYQIGHKLIGKRLDTMPYHIIPW